MNQRKRRIHLDEFFRDSHGFLSMTRLAFFAVNLTSIFVVVWCTVYSRLAEATSFIGIWQGIGVAGKVAQKQVEERTQALESPESSEG